MLHLIAVQDGGRVVKFTIDQTPHPTGKALAAAIAAALTDCLHIAPSEQVWVYRLTSDADVVYAGVF